MPRVPSLSSAPGPRQRRSKDPAADRGDAVAAAGSRLPVPGGKSCTLWERAQLTASSKACRTTARTPYPPRGPRTHRPNASLDVLPAVNCGDSSCRPAVSMAVHAAIAVGWSVVEVRAERLCRILARALRRALMRATDLREGGCLRPRRLRADAPRLDFGDSSTP